MKIIKCDDLSERTKAFLHSKRIAVIGYGSQGRAQARMLLESGVDVIVGVRVDGPSCKQAVADGLRVASIAAAVQQADIVHILLPDEAQKKVFNEDIAPYLAPGMLVGFSHGFSIIYGEVEPPAGVGIFLVAPKAPGTEEYKAYRRGYGVPALVGVYRETSEAGYAMEAALAMAFAMQFTRPGVMVSTFASETFQDLFGEQAVLCGGLSALVKAAFEIIVERGYPAEIAYFECVHELKLIIDLIIEGGLSRMWEVVSNTAEFGGHTRGPRVFGEALKNNLRQILDEIEDGSFAADMFNERDEHNFGTLLSYRKAESEKEIEVVGKMVREEFGFSSGRI